MRRSVRVHFLPRLIEQGSLSERSAVVIDVLRASTTIVHALAHGAARVVPCLEPDHAHTVARRYAPHALLGGERGGLRIPGFDLGNSPAEYDRPVVAAKTIVFTTTNGTRALQTCHDADQILIGAFVNLSAICRELRDCPRIDLVCAGTAGEVTREDVLLAGALLARLCEQDGREPAEYNDSAQLAVDAWRESVGDRTDPSRVPTERLVETLRASQGGRNLLEIGHASDVELAAQVDRFDLVPRATPVPPDSTTRTASRSPATPASQDSLEASIREFEIRA